MVKQMAVTAAVVVVAMTALSARQHEQHQPRPGQKPDHMQHAFDDPDRYAKQFDDPARDAWQMPDRVIAALGLKAGQSVADIGAGTGYFSMRLAKAAGAPLVYAVDIEPKMVAYLRGRAAREGLKNVTAVHGSAGSPNLPSPVDTILVVDTYHHIANRVEYFRKLRASLKPGGQLAIVDFRKDAPDGPPVEFRFTADEISAELATAGYRLAASHAFLPRQLFLIYSLQ
jgi:cyclopropane fatty-acyl-phospholipid synthase-like methyltransferase